MKNWGDYYLGVACYHCNELETADHYFTQIIKNRYIAHGSAYRDAVAGLALIHQIKGESAEAWQMVELISQFDLEQSGSEDDRTRSLRARLMLLQGDLEGAGRWVDTFSGLPPDQPLLWLEEPQVTRARVLLARGTNPILQLAMQILDVLDEITERTHNTRYKIEILALRALALDAQGKPPQPRPRWSRRWIWRGRAALSGSSPIWVDPWRKCCAGLRSKVMREEMIAPHPDRVPRG